MVMFQVTGKQVSFRMRIGEEPHFIQVSELLTLRTSAIELVPAGSMRPTNPSVPQSSLRDKSTDVREGLREIATASDFIPSSPMQLFATLTKRYVSVESKFRIGCLQEKKKERTLSFLGMC